METQEQNRQELNGHGKASVMALFPFLVFLVFYLGVSIVARDFYKMPMPVAFLVSSAVAPVLSAVAGGRVDCCHFLVPCASSREKIGNGGINLTQLTTAYRQFYCRRTLYIAWSGKSFA
ncbi:MAG: hypothetical protein IJJ33_01600 [Victivallales bacterium]|nr:hypothetical protein [Victivallales bacterium]